MSHCLSAEEFEKLLDALDGPENPEWIEFVEHIKNCEDCQKQFLPLIDIEEVLVEAELIAIKDEQEQITVREIRTMTSQVARRVLQDIAPGEIDNLDRINERLLDRLEQGRFKAGKANIISEAAIIGPSKQGSFASQTLILSYFLSEFAIQNGVGKLFETYILTAEKKYSHKLLDKIATQVKSSLLGN